MKCDCQQVLAVLHQFINHNHDCQSGVNICKTLPNALILRQRLQCIFIPFGSISWKPWSDRQIRVLRFRTLLRAVAFIQSLLSLARECIIQFTLVFQLSLRASLNLTLKFFSASSSDFPKANESLEKGETRTKISEGWRMCLYHLKQLTLLYW